MSSKILEQDLVSAIGEDRTLGREYRDLGRVILQGLTLGTADEIEAAITAVSTGQSYGDARKELMKGIEKKRQDFPAGAFALELMGGMPSGALGVGRTLTSTAARSAGLGGTYGYFGAEPEAELTEDPFAAERLAQMGVGAGLAGTLSPIAQKIFPQRPEAASDLIKRGVPLTAGQAAGRGTFLSRMENIVENTLPAIGELAGSARKKSTLEFNRLAVDEALQPIAAKMGKENETIQDFAIYANKQIDEAYASALKGVTIPSDEINTVKTALSKIADKYEGYEGGEKINNMIKNFAARIERNADDPQKIMAHFRTLRDMGTKRMKAIDPKSQEMGEALYEASQEFAELLMRYNPDNRELFASANQAFRNFLPIRKAINDAVKKGNEIVSPKQMLNKISELDGTERKMTMLKGALPIQKTATQALQTIGDPQAGSQTAERMAGTRLLTGGGILGGSGTGLMPASGYVTLGALGAGYAAPVAGRKFATGISAGLRGSGAPMAGLIADRPVVGLQNIGLLEQ